MPTGVRTRRAHVQAPIDGTSPLDDDVTGAVAGDANAFARLWAATNPPLVRYLQVKAPGHAEDVAAETWVSVVRGIRRFEGDERCFKNWLYTIARHKAADVARDETRKPLTFLRDYDNISHPESADSCTMALNAMSTDTALEIIRRLPEDQAEVLTLRVVADLDVASVADIVGKSTGAVRVTQHRGLKRLAAMLSLGQRAEPGKEV